VDQPPSTTDYKENVDTALKVIDILQDGTEVSKGPMYVIGRIMETVGDDRPFKVKTGPSEEGDRVTTDKSGVDYPTDTYCLTSACVNSTIDYYNKEKLEDIFPNVPIPVNREMLTMSMFIMPAIIALLGLCGCMCCGKKWQRCPICLMLLLIVIVLPWILIIVGSIMFPSFMLIGDVCESAEDLGYNFVSQTEESYCTGVWNAADKSCTFDLFEDRTLDVKISESYRDIFGDCDLQPNIWVPVWSSLKSSLAPFPREKVADFMKEMDDGNFEGIQLKQPMEDIAYEAADGLGDNVETFIDDISNVLSCDNVHDMYFDFKESFCSHIASSLAWFVISWYIIGLAMCFCGCCAGVLGYKRFPSKTWGKQVEDKVNEAKGAAAEEKEEEPLPVPDTAEVVPPPPSAPDDFYIQPAGGFAEPVPHPAHIKNGKPAVLSTDYELPSYAGGAATLPPARGRKKSTGRKPQGTRSPKKGDPRNHARNHGRMPAGSPFTQNHGGIAAMPPPAYMPVNVPGPAGPGGFFGAEQGGYGASSQHVAMSQSFNPYARNPYA
jgi:hypothetical protein